MSDMLPVGRSAEVHVLFAGYVGPRTASTVTYVRDAEARVIVDPGMVPGRGAILDELARLGVAPEALLVAPPPIKPVPEPWGESWEGAEAKSRKLAEHYRRIAAEHECAFLNAGDYIASSDEDGIHWEATEHSKLGKALVGLVRHLIG